MLALARGACIPWRAGMGSNGWGTIVATVRWALAALAVLLATAAPAAAATTTTRYVSATGTGTACTQAAPCELVFGWLGATVGGDTVSIAPGTYGSAAAPILAPLGDNPGKVLHISGGATGPDRPVIWSKGGIKLYQAGSTVTDVESHSTEGIGLELIDASADRIVATVPAANDDYDACSIAPGATLTNSLCIGAASRHRLGAAGHRGRHDDPQRHRLRTRLRPVRRGRRGDDRQHGHGWDR